MQEELSKNGIEYMSRHLQYLLQREMCRYKKICDTVDFAIGMSLMSLIGLAILIFLDWIYLHTSWNTELAYIYGLMYLAYCGYVFRCREEAIESASRVSYVMARVYELGLKIVFRPVRGDTIEDGLHIVENSHPQEGIDRCRDWSRWECLSEYT